MLFSGLFIYFWNLNSLIYFLPVLLTLNLNRKVTPDGKMTFSSHNDNCYLVSLQPCKKLSASFLYEKPK